MIYDHPFVNVTEFIAHLSPIAAVDGNIVFILMSGYILSINN